jgi:hypothetical protein
LNASPKTADSQPRWRPGALLLRLAPAGIFFIVFFYMVNPYYVRLYMPLIAEQLEWMDPAYDVKINEIVTIDRIDYLRYTITVNKSMANNPHAPLETGNTVRLKAQANTLCIAPIIVFSLILAWPGITLLDRFQTLLISLPLLILMHTLDLPMIFIEKIEAAHSTSVWGNTARAVWTHVLSNGGRQFLAIVVFLISIAPIYLKLDQSLLPAAGPPTVGPRRNDPCPCGSGKKYKQCCLNGYND